MPYVELDGGFRMMTNFNAGPNEADIGTHVMVRFVETDEEDIAIPVFVPVGD